MLALVQFLAIVSVSAFGAGIAYRRYRIAQRDQGLRLVSKAAELLASDHPDTRRAGILLLLEATDIAPSSSAALHLLDRCIRKADRDELAELKPLVEGKSLEPYVKARQHVLALNEGSDET